jgi:Domain of unknown function (DUF6484)
VQRTMDDLVKRLKIGTSKFSIRRFIGFDTTGMPLVALAANDMSKTPSFSLVPLSRDQEGAEVAVVWLAEEEAPLIVGLIQPPKFVAEVGEDELIIENDRKVVLRCGRASITLRPDGSISIRGGQILSRADGANRVQGATVQLN